MDYNELCNLPNEEIENWFLDAYDKNILLDDSAYREMFKEICWGEWFPIIEQDREEDRRWSAWINIIFKVKDRYFRIGYDMGLTEYQENDYYDKSITEVYPVERLIAVTDWIEK